MMCHHVAENAQTRGLDSVASLITIWLKLDPAIQLKISVSLVRINMSIHAWVDNPHVRTHGTVRKYSET
jgi:hypothetical protein